MKPSCPADARRQARDGAVGPLYERNGIPTRGIAGAHGWERKLGMVIDRLKTRFVDIDDDRIFANVTHG